MLSSPDPNLEQVTESEGNSLDLVWKETTQDSQGQKKLSFSDEVAAVCKALTKHRADWCSNCYQADVLPMDEKKCKVTIIKANPSSSCCWAQSDADISDRLNLLESLLEQGEESRPLDEKGHAPGQQGYQRDEEHGEHPGAKSAWEKLVPAEQVLAPDGTLAHQYDVCCGFSRSSHGSHDIELGATKARPHLKYECELSPEVPNEVWMKNFYPDRRVMYIVKEQWKEQVVARMWCCTMS